MTIFFAGGELDAFEMVGSLPSTSTSTTRFDSSYARAAIGVDPVNPILARLPAAQSEIWHHCDVSRQAIAGTVTVLEFRNASNVGCVRLRFTSSTNSLALEYWNGTSWVSVGSTTAVATDVLYSFDTHIKIADVGGVFEFYINGALLLSYSGDTNLSTGSAVENILHGGFYTAGTFTYFSQVIVANEDTRSMKLATLVPNANGAVDQWTGSYADVDETNINDSDYIYTGVANYTELMGLSDLSTTAQTLDVVAFVQTARGRKGLSGPQNIQASVYTGGTQYNSGNLTGLGTSFATIQQTIWETNPGTSSGWTIAEIQSLQMGYKSIA